MNSYPHRPVIGECPALLLLLGTSVCGLLSLTVDQSWALVVDPSPEQGDHCGGPVWQLVRVLKQAGHSRRAPWEKGGEELEVSAFSAVVVVGRRDRFLTHFTLKLLAGCPTSVLC